MVSLGECAKVVRKKYNLAWLIESRIFPNKKIGYVIPISKIFIILILTEVLSARDILEKFKGSTDFMVI